MINKHQIIEKGGICLPNIQYGFDHYPYDILTGDFIQFYDVLMAAASWNTPEETYADFYYSNLSPQEKKKLLDALSPENQSLIESMPIHPDQIYFQPNQEMLSLLLELSYRELLFSTFYFTRYPCTLWGNYEGKFPIFYRDLFTKKIYHRHILEMTGIDFER